MGKFVKGLGGLKMHQRSCRVIHGLNNELCAELEEQNADDNTEGVLADDEVTNLLNYG